MASKNKQKKTNNGDQPIDSDSGSDSGDDEKYTGNEVAFHICEVEKNVPIYCFLYRLFKWNSRDEIQ